MLYEIVNPINDDVSEIFSISTVLSLSKLCIKSVEEVSPWSIVSWLPLTDQSPISTVSFEISNSKKVLLLKKSILYGLSESGFVSVKLNELSETIVLPAEVKIEPSVVIDCVIQ